MRNLILDPLPHTVRVGEEDVPIRWDFRTSMLFEMLMQEESLPEEQRLLQGLALYYPQPPRDLPTAVDAMLWFYRCGREEGDGSKGGPARAAGPAYSYDADADYIYAAFLGQYGVDLTCATLHWWQFRALFRALTADNEFVKIMGYRSMVIDHRLSPEQQRFYREMKKMVAIPLPKHRQQQVSALEEALMNGGDVGALLHHQDAP